MFRSTRKLLKYKKDLLLETRSEFYALLVKKFTSEFQQLNTEQFNLYTILDIYWQIGNLQYRGLDQKAFISNLLSYFQLNSILKCDSFNMKLFLKDFRFLQENIRPNIIEQIYSDFEFQNSKIILNFCQIKIFGLEESGDFKKIGIFSQAQDCNSLLQLIEEQIKTVIKKFQKFLIIIMSVDRINQQCKEKINNQILSFHHSNIELKYFSIKQKQRKQMLQFQQRQSQISEQEWDFLEIEYFKQRYTLQNEGLFLSYKELSENVDEELFSFECQIHNQNINL